MNTREIFEHVRKHQKNRIPLRARMTIVVTFEMLVSIAVAYGIDRLLHILLPDLSIPLVADLLAVCLLVGIILTSQLSKSFFNPIKKLRGAMDRVADGDFSVRLQEHSSSKEIMEIYTGFNLMAHELEATDILQTDFVSNVSHEFKTPINAIEGYSTLLQDSENLSPAQQEYVEKILFNTGRLSTLVGSILLLSKLENQQIPTSHVTYRLDEQIRQSIVALEASWAQKNIEFEADLDRQVYTGNEAMMRHVWDNLLSNAIKFSPEGGVILVGLHRTGDTLTVTVDDRGPGLSEEAQKHLFDKFYQGDPSHRQEGNGLGLALVKRILALEHGAVAAENRSGGGCRFTVTLSVQP